jgi:DNA primase
MIQEQIASILNSQGFKVYRGFRFSLRLDDNTPSAIINKNGSIHDFGTGWHGDVISVLREFRNMSFQEAKNIYESNIGEMKPTTSFKSDYQVEKKNTALPESFLEKFVADRRSDFSNFKMELSRMLDTNYGCCVKDIKDTALEFDIGWNKRSQRLIMPLRDKDDNIVNFWKYQKNGIPKVLFSKGRIVPSLGLNRLAHSEVSTVYIVEGEKDVIAMTMYGLTAINGKTLTSDDYKLLGGKQIYLCGDYDDAGQEFNKRLYDILIQYSDNVNLWIWEKVSLANPKFYLDKKCDMSDYVAFCIYNNFS